MTHENLCCLRSLSAHFGKNCVRILRIVFMLELKECPYMLSGTAFLMIDQAEKPEWKFHSDSKRKTYGKYSCNKPYVFFMHDNRKFMKEKSRFTVAFLRGRRERKFFLLLFGGAIARLSRFVQVLREMEMQNRIGKSQARSQTIQIVPLTEALKLRLLLGGGELIHLGRHIGFWKCSEIKIIF